MAPNVFAYGLAHILQRSSRGSFVVDKTKFLEQLFDVAGEHVMLLYPPRFGKSFFLTMLHTWYNMKTKEEDWDACFKSSTLSTTQLVERRSYYVLKLSLEVDVTQVSSTGIKKALDENISGSLDDFCAEYELDVADLKHGNALEYLKGVGRAIARKSGKLMVLVDEYDRYFNKVLTEGDGVRLDAVTVFDRQTLLSPLGSFFEALKSMQTFPLRTFRTVTAGIAPLALAESSSWNIGTSTSTVEQCWDLMGFSDEDIRSGLRLVPHITDAQTGHFLEIFRRFYNGYRFHVNRPSVYNPTQCLFLLSRLFADERLCERLSQHEEVNDTAVLEKLDDPNVNASSSLLIALVSVGGHVATAVWEACNAEEGVTTSCSSLTDRLRVSELTLFCSTESSQEPEARVRSTALAILTHQGVLTRKCSSSTPNMVIVGVPNKIVRLRHMLQL